jgi:hypothetical protein
MFVGILSGYPAKRLSLRSVFVHLWHTSEGEVAAAFDQLYTPNGSAAWMIERSGDPHIYIDFYRDGPLEDEVWIARFTDRGGPPPVSVIANISGRHDGWPEAQAFVSDTLARFNGVATDDGWLRLWTGPEVREDARVDGRLFGYWRA